MCASFGSLRSVTMPGGSQSAEASSRNDRQELAQPACVVRRRENPSHEIRFGQAGRQEVLAGRFVREGAGHVAQVEEARTILDQPTHVRVAGAHGPVVHESEGECGLAVLADANRVTQLGQPGPQTLRDFRLERCQRCRPASCLRIVPGMQLRSEHQQPGQAVGPFERRTARRLEVADLGRDVGSGQAAFQRGTGLGGEGCLRVQARETCQQPVTVDRRVPVETPVERGSQLARWAHVGVTLQRMRQLVRILEVGAVQREIREASGGGIEVRRAGRGCAGHGEQREHGARRAPDQRSTLPSASTTCTAPSPSARIGASMRARSPTMTQVSAVGTEGTGGRLSHAGIGLRFESLLQRPHPVVRPAKAHDVGDGTADRRIGLVLARECAHVALGDFFDFGGRRRLAADELRDLATDFRDRLERTIGLDRRRQQPRPLPERLRQARARAVRPVLLLAQVHVDARRERAAEHGIRGVELDAVRRKARGHQLADEDRRLLRARPVEQVDVRGRRGRGGGNGPAREFGACGRVQLPK